jgi:hypothetical protein
MTMTYGKLAASSLKTGDFTVPPRNNGRFKEIAAIASHGRNVTFTFVDASKMSVGKSEQIAVGVAAHFPPLN